MSTLQIDILNPKATKLLEMLADLKLISIRTEHEETFSEALKKVRKKVEKHPPTLEEITREVETVRAARYARSRK